MVRCSEGEGCSAVVRCTEATQGNGAVRAWCSVRPLGLLVRILPKISLNMAPPPPFLTATLLRATSSHTMFFYLITKRACHSGAGMLRLRERMEQGGLSTSLPDIRLGQEGGSLANLASKALDNQRGHQATQRLVELFMEYLHKQTDKHKLK